MAVLAAAGGLRDAAIGVGFLFSLAEIRQTLLYQNYNELIPGITGPIVGLAFILVGLFVAWCATAGRNREARFGLRVQAFLWLFSAFMYALNGGWLLAVIFGVGFSFFAGYLAFFQKHGVDFSEG
jgi:hypothetical protein